MEHIIQFGVSIDESAIVDKATGQAASSIISMVKKELDAYTRGYSDTKLERIIREEVKELLDVNYDTIMEKAIERLVLNMSKTKKIREALAELEV